jgi:hypothetical protein
VGRTVRKVSEIGLTAFERHPRTRVQLVSNKDDLAAETLGPERATDADVAGGDIVDAGGRASKTSPTRAPCIHVGAESFLIKNHQFRARCALDCGIQSQAPEDTSIGIPGSSGAPIKRIQGHRGENA